MSFALTHTQTYTHVKIFYSGDFARSHYSFDFFFSSVVVGATFLFFTFSIFFFFVLLLNPEDREGCSTRYAGTSNGKKYYGKNCGDFRATLCRD